MKLYSRETSDLAWGSDSDTWYRIEGLLRSFTAPDSDIEYETLFWAGSKPELLQWMRSKKLGKLIYYPWSGRLWRYGFGKVTSNGSLDTLEITDTFGESPPIFELTYFTPEEFARVWHECFIDKIMFTLEKEGLFTTEMDLIAKRHEKNDIYRSKDIDPIKRPKNISIAYKSNLSIGNISSSKAFSAEFSLKNNLTSLYWNTTNGSPNRILPKKREIEGRFKFYVDSSELWDMLDNYTVSTDCTLAIWRNNSDYARIKGIDGHLKSAPHNIPEEGAVEVEVSAIFKDLKIELRGHWRG